MAGACPGGNRRTHQQILAAAKRYCPSRTARVTEPSQLNICRSLSVFARLPPVVKYGPLDDRDLADTLLRIDERSKFQTQKGLQRDYTVRELRLLARSSGTERKSCECGFQATKARVRFVRRAYPPCRRHRDAGVALARARTPPQHLAPYSEVE